MTASGNVRPFEARQQQAFATRYGPWAVITGASSGIGEAFAHAVAARGLQPLLIARREDALRRVAADIERQHGVACEILVADLADPDFIIAVQAACESRDVGLVISNAAANPAGAFLDHSALTHAQLLDVNCRATVLLAETFLPRLQQRGRGGLLLVASTEAFFGLPYSALYSASKAFVLSLGEALWGEFSGQGVDVLVLAPGATDTPLLASRQIKTRAMSPRAVAEIGLRHLGKGPSIIPGAVNRWTFRILRRLPRAWAVRLVAPAMHRMIERLKGTAPMP